MNIQPIVTPVFKKGECLTSFILRNAKEHLKEQSLLCVTSKIVSLAEKRVLNKANLAKKALVKKESDVYLGPGGHGTHLTIKEGLLIPSAGVDESNSPDEEYILYPKDPFASAHNLRKALQSKLSLKHLGVMLTDSRTLPLRRGVVGVALAYSGFRGLRDLRGTKDLFGRPLRMTTINIADAIAGAGVLLMGEGANRCPLALVEEAPVCWINQTEPKELAIPLKEDLYYPLLK